MTAKTFLEMGFSNSVTETSVPSFYGYIGTLKGYPYNIHPIETPEEYAALQVAIDDDLVTVNPYLPPPPPTPEQVRARLRGQAAKELDKSDTTVLRCLEAGESIPPAWVKYRSDLRVIIGGSDSTSIELPSKPAYP